MHTLRARVHIIGVAEVEPPASVRPSLEGMIFACVTDALADAGIGRSEIDGVVIAASDQTDGRAISSMLTSGPAGAYLSDEINIASSPGHAFAMACLQIESGAQRRVLVASWGKASEIAGTGIEDAERLSAEPFFDRDAGVTRLAALGMQAGLYRRSRPRAAEAAAVVAAKNHNNAAGEDAEAVSAEDVARSPLLAEPLRQLEVAAASDGAYAVVLGEGSSRHERAVAVSGLAWYSEAYRLSDRDLAGAPHLRLAAAAAFREANIRDPRSEVDLWELHDETADAELLAYEAVGLCEDGGAPELALSGATARKGEYPVNPLGGAVAGEAPFGGGLRKLVRASRYVRGDVPSIPAASVSFVQIASGFAGQFQSAFVLRACR